MFEKFPHIGSTAFERVDGGFVFYASAWSKGIPVSAAAREAYFFGPRGEWFEAPAGFGSPRAATSPGTSAIGWRVQRVIATPLI
jgi:hypothetical protein